MRLRAETATAAAAASAAMAEDPWPQSPAGALVPCQGTRRQPSMAAMVLLLNLCLLLPGRAHSAGWARPCVDQSSECEAYAEQYPCDTELMVSNCCESCTKKATAQGGGYCSAATGLTSAAQQIHAACRPNDVVDATECRSAGEPACRRALAELTAATSSLDAAEDDACNAHLFQPPTAHATVYWAACASATPGAQPVVIRSAADLRRSLDVGTPSLVMSADIDFTQSYRPKTDIDRHGCRAIALGIQGALMIRGSSAPGERLMSLTARFAVNYGSLSIRNIRLAEYDYVATCPDPSLPPSEYPGAVIYQTGGNVAVVNALITTPSPYPYGHAIVSDRQGETLIRDSRFYVPSAAAQQAGLQACAPTPASLGASATHCTLAVDEMRVSVVGNDVSICCPHLSILLMFCCTSILTLCAYHACLWDPLRIVATGRFPRRWARRSPCEVPSRLRA